MFTTASLTWHFVNGVALPRCPMGQPLTEN
jgi:hypothetical protein